MRTYIAVALMLIAIFAMAHSAPPAYLKILAFPPSASDNPLPRSS